MAKSDEDVRYYVFSGREVSVLTRTQLQNLMFNEVFAGYPLEEQTAYRAILLNDGKHDISSVQSNGEKVLIIRGKNVTPTQVRRVVHWEIE